jgi:hypothetical protein
MATLAALLVFSAGCGGSATLRRFAQYREPCSGFIDHPMACDTGLACSHVDADGSFIHPDLPGVCLLSVGQHCGGFASVPTVCAAPLHCDLDRNGDVGGICMP